MEGAFSKLALEDIQVNDQQQSPLFRLPVELRDHIYQLVLTAERPFVRLTRMSLPTCLRHLLILISFILGRQIQD